MKLTPLQRLENSLTVDENGCWISSIGAGSEDKHTRFKIGRQKVRAHRYMYEQKVGPIAKDQRVYHTCDNQKCCNPDHLALKNVKSKEERDAEKGPPVVPLPAFDHLMRSITVDENGCWISSLGAEAKGSYSKVKEEGQNIRGHRLMYSAVYGPIPDGLSVCHKCDTPKCINPTHLFLGTHKDNMQDMHAKGRARGGKKRVPKATIIAARKVSPNKSFAELAKDLGCHHSTVYKVLNETGLRKASYKRGEYDERVLALIHEDPSKSVAKVAAEVGCSDNTVDRIILRHKINRRELKKTMLECSHS